MLSIRNGVRFVLGARNIARLITMIIEVSMLLVEAPVITSISNTCFRFEVAYNKDS
jgi:hypothetical protein